MLTIRLLRTGKKNQPSYKVVVTDKRNPPKGGKSVEEVGFFNPKTKGKQFNKERILYWLSVGAQPSDTVHNMLVNEKIINQPKRKIIFTKKEPEPVKEESPKAVTEPTAATESVEPVEAESAEPVEAEEPKPAE
jgi:small subunit ribosomal protein S16